MEAKLSVLLSFLCLQITLIESSTSNAGHNRREEPAMRISKSKEILKYMNPSSDPCADFFEFACGNWSQFFPSTEGNIRTVQKEIECRLNNDLQVMLEEPLNQNDGINGRKIKDFYKACLGAENRYGAQKAFFLDFVKKHGGLPALPETRWRPRYDWEQVIGNLRANYGMDIIMGVELDTNPMHGNRILLTEPKHTLMPPEICSAETMTQADIREDPYEELQKKISANLQNWLGLPSTEASRMAGDIVSFEFKLCKKMREDELITTSTEDAEDTAMRTEKHGAPPIKFQNRKLKNQIIEKVSPSSLQKLTEQFESVINFRQFVDASFDTSINDQVYLRSVSYFNHLTRVLKITEKQTLAGYIIYRALASLNFPHGDAPKERSKYCVGLVQRYMPKVVSGMLSRKIYNGDSKTDVENVFQQIVKAFEESFNVGWMGENTRRSSVQRLTQFKLRFPLYQDINLSDLETDHMDYWRKLQQIMKYHTAKTLHNPDFSSRQKDIETSDVDTRYQSISNEIQVGWGLLRQPFYHPYYPHALKFAIIGQRLARSLTFAFAELGWNKYLQMSPMHWDEHTTEGFRNRTRCLRTQFSNYIHNNPDEFRNYTKLYELIADGSGLNVAFRAYLSWLDSIDPVNRLTLAKETLPNLNFTNTQLFFIHFAQTRCTARYSESSLAEFLPKEKHTWERYNVNGPLSNSVEFAREFNCAPGTEMNPDDKCMIYQ